MRVLTWGGLLSFVAIGVLNATAIPVRAQEWCGFHDKTGSLVRCGYSSLAECKQNLAGKNPVCIPNPEFAVQERSQRQQLALANS
jgi:hypothetical protein